SGSLAASDTIAFRDLDLIDVHTASYVPVSLTSSAHLPGFPANMTYLGSFTLSTVNENNADSDNTGSVGWTFTLANNDPTLQSLAFGQNITQIYAVTLSDHHGGMVTQNVTVTITGTNDAPVIAAQDLTGAVTEQVTPDGNLTD